MQVHMAAGDHSSLIEDCMRLGDASRGGDPHLWSEVLQYFARQSQDCTEQVPLCLITQTCVLSYICVSNCRYTHIHVLLQASIF